MPSPAAEPLPLPGSPDRVAARPSRTLWALIAAFVAAVGVGGYVATGTPDYEEQLAQVAAEAHAGASADPQQAQALVQALSDRLHANPDDVAGWAMLGRMQLMLGRPAESVRAYRRALAMQPDEPTLLADTAEALAVQGGRSSLTGEPTQLLERALKLDPDQPKALALAGASAFDRRDFAQAVRHWERLLALSPPQAEYLESLRQGIAEARQLGGLAPAPAGGAPARPASR